MRSTKKAPAGQLSTWHCHYWAWGCRRITSIQARQQILTGGNQVLIYLAVILRCERQWKTAAITNFRGFIIMAEKQTQRALSLREALNGQRVLTISEPVIKIAIWKVRTLFEARKLENVTLEMERLELNILGISKHRGRVLVKQKQLMA